MKTELEVVYNIINVARAGEHNNDEPITERLVRSFMRNHRADCLRKYYKDGQIVDDEVFQDIELKIFKITSTLFQTKIPKAIRFQNHNGFYIEKENVIIPIVLSHQYILNKNNPYNVNFLFCKTENQLVTLNIPNTTLIQNADHASENYIMIESVMDEILTQEIFNFNNPNLTKPVHVKVNLHAVLLDPSDDPNYNWEKDIYPFPAERLVELENQILAKEFGIMANTKKDEVQNAKGDENDGINKTYKTNRQQE